MGISRSPTRESPLAIDSLNTHIDGNSITLDGPSTSPTSSYPLSTGIASSPLNPATSGHPHIGDADTAAPSEPSESANMDSVATPSTVKRERLGAVRLTTLVLGTPPATSAEKA